MSNSFITAKDLRLGYDSKVILSDVSVEIPDGKISVIMGGSGCGKSTLLKSLIGLLTPMGGQVNYAGDPLYAMNEAERKAQLRNIGVLYQGGALWSDRTIAENVAYPLEEFTELSAHDIAMLVDYKLALVGMDGSQDLYPDELSGGMRKRAALARAMVMDPKVLFLDEPSAGLDPRSSRRLDELIIQLSEGLNTTFVVITHELDSIHAIAQNCIHIADGGIAATGSIDEIKASSPAAKSFLEGYKLG